MKNIIKKVLKEFNDPLQWMRDINPIYEGSYYIDIEGLDNNEKCRIQQVLLDLGFRWNSIGVDDPDNKINKNACTKPNKAYSISNQSNGNKRLYRTTMTYEELDRPEYMDYLTTEQFLKMVDKNLNESNDFDWVKGGGLINPWEIDYTGVEFDIEPSVEDINTLIEMVLGIKEVSNADFWVRDFRGDDIQRILHYFHKKGKAYLTYQSHDGILSYSSRSDYSDWVNVRWVKYSNLINKPLTESEWDWVKNINPDVLEYMDNLTKDNPRINVKFSYGKNGSIIFHSIKDHNGMHYFTDEDLVSYLYDNYLSYPEVERILNTPNNYTDDDIKLLEDITITPQMLIDYIDTTLEDFGGSNEDYDDFIELRKVLSSITKNS